MRHLNLCSFDQDISSIFENFFNDSDFSIYQKPALIEWEDDKGTIVIEAPGFSKNEIKVEANTDGISIKGEISDDKIKNRLSKSNFSYILKRTDIDLQNIDAKLENGILIIVIQKSKDKESKIIEIK